jgi:hypothetical protein
MVHWKILPEAEMWTVNFLATPCSIRLCRVEVILMSANITFRLHPTSVVLNLACSFSMITLMCVIMLNDVHHLLCSLKQFESLLGFTKQECVYSEGEGWYCQNEKLQ